MRASATPRMERLITSFSLGTTENNVRAAVGPT